MLSVGACRMHQVGEFSPLALKVVYPLTKWNGKPPLNIFIKSEWRRTLHGTEKDGGVGSGWYNKFHVES